ncbi:unnamed protein product, partial [Musa textilis]
AEPNSGNGLDLSKYSWTRTLQDTHLKVGLKGQLPFICISLWIVDYMFDKGWKIHFQAKSDGMVEILQKMMFEQWQKAMNLPTSDEM